MADNFQMGVDKWVHACFGPDEAADRTVRGHRFLEEALELFQANESTASEAHQLVDYVFSRPVGDIDQEIGGVMLTLAALCSARGKSMSLAGDAELGRVWTKVEKIRAKHSAKPKCSPLPQAWDDGKAALVARIAELERQNSDLQAANNAYLERARKAEAENSIGDDGRESLPRAFRRIAGRIATAHALVAANAVLRAYEAWEAELILNGDWSGDAGVRMSQAQHDRILEIQAMRNAALYPEAERARLVGEGKIE